MSKAPGNNAPKQPRSKLKIALIVLAVLIVSLIALERIGRVVQANVTDGIERYSGIQQEVAKKGVTFEETLNGITPINYQTTVRVEEVRPINPGEIEHCRDYIGYSADPNDIRHYAVTLSNRIYFGINIKTNTWYGCAQLGT